MFNYLQVTAQTRRESETERKVRAIDTYEIIEWIHRLEDEIEHLCEELKGDQ